MIALVENVRNATVRFHREQHGCAPGDCAVRWLGDMVLVVSKGVFTPNEQALLADPEGRKMVAAARREHRSLTRDDVEAAVARACGRRVLRSYYDLDVRIGEQVEVFVLE